MGILSMKSPYNVSVITVPCFVGEKFSSDRVFLSIQIFRTLTIAKTFKCTKKIGLRKDLLKIQAFNPLMPGLPPGIKGLIWQTIFELYATTSIFPTSKKSSKMAI